MKVTVYVYGMYTVVYHYGRVNFINVCTCVNKIKKDNKESLQIVIVNSTLIFSSLITLYDTLNCKGKKSA